MQDSAGGGTPPGALSSEALASLTLTQNFDGAYASDAVTTSALPPPFWKRTGLHNPSGDHATFSPSGSFADEASMGERDKRTMVEKAAGLLNDQREAEERKAAAAKTAAEAATVKQEEDKKGRLAAELALPDLDDMITRNKERISAAQAARSCAPGAIDSGASSPNATKSLTASAANAGNKVRLSATLFDEHAVASPSGVRWTHSSPL